jgi:hypothetical protein
MWKIALAHDVNVELVDDAMVNIALAHDVNMK